MIENLLRENDDRLGFVDEQNNLVYPAFDAFGSAIPVRSAVQVLWVSVLFNKPRFICLPASVDLNDVVFALDVPQGEGEIILESILPVEPEVVTMSIDPALVEGEPPADEPETPEPPKPAKKKR